MKSTSGFHGILFSFLFFLGTCLSISPISNVSADLTREEIASIEEFLDNNYPGLKIIPFSNGFNLSNGIDILMVTPTSDGGFRIDNGDETVQLTMLHGDISELSGVELRGILQVFEGIVERATNIPILVIDFIENFPWPSHFLSS